MDEEFLIKTSYFTGWNMGARSGGAAVYFNDITLCSDSPVNSEDMGRKVDSFVVSAK